MIVDQNRKIASMVGNLAVCIHIGYEAKEITDKHTFDLVVCKALPGVQLLHILQSEIKGTVHIRAIILMQTVVLTNCLDEQST